MGKGKHIDDVQPATVDEHFKSLVEEESVVDPNWSEVTYDDLPEWYDEKLFKQGQAYYMKNLLSMGIGALLGLIAIIVVPETLKVLIFTKQSSTVCAAFKRYSQTLLHTYMLYSVDIKDPKWFKSLNVIRWKHSTNSRRSVAANVGGILQRDMAITQFGFIGYILLNYKNLGLTNNPEEREGFIHLWRVVGHLLGISDRINICRKTDAETTELCRRIGKEILGKEMEKHSPAYLQVARTIVDGIWYIDVGFDTEAMIALTYNLTGIEYKQELGWYSRLNYEYRNIVLYSCGLPYIGAVVRTYFNYMLKLLYWLLQNYPIYAIMFLGKENSHVNLYPIYR